jgi:DNA-binding SARP family transcriptional activator/predicted ATPase
MSRLALYLLGPPRVELAGEPIHIGRTKAVALLAYLVFTAAPHRRDTLAALLWPEYDQSSARADLRRTLSILNRTLGKGWLVADRETAGLNPDEDLWLDVHAFRQRLASCQAHAHPPKELCEACVPLLEEAVELYRDDFLAGFTLRDSLAFDEWQFFQTERLKDQWASALECLVRWYAGREAYDQAIAYARRRLERDALNDAAHQELMVLFALADQQTAALRQYGLCEQILAEELGVSPSAETTALYERIRAGEDIEREPEVVVPHNLLPQSTPFVGREKELAELSDLISDPERRLVTILGPGGIGKSRLALAVAERQLVLPPSGGGERGGRTTESSFLNGVYFVPLARLSAADQITTTLADALDFRLGGGAQDSRIPRQQVLDYLREKRLLLILDNFEHLLSSPLPAGHPPRRGGTGGGASITSDILRAAPGVQMLVTSRERLQLREEHAYNLQGLAYPEDTKAADWDQYAATQLFLNTARRIQAGFKLGSDDADSLMRICQLLDGMPLGIELAAGWVDVLSLDDIATEIQRGIDFLETEWSDVPARHRSMRAAFGASWRRLTEAEKAVFAQLSVFRGGFTRQAAREVTGADLRTLARLADKSLLRFSRERERYDLHELLRQYGCERLAADTERDYATRERHSAYYCATLQVWEADLTGARCRAALAEIEADLGNVLLAWEWAVKKTDVGRLNRAVDGLGRVGSTNCRIVFAMGKRFLSRRPTLFQRRIW